MVSTRRLPALTLASLPTASTGALGNSNADFLLFSQKLKDTEAHCEMILSDFSLGKRNLPVFLPA